MLQKLKFSHIYFLAIVGLLFACSEEIVEKSDTANSLLGFLL